jgi:hypothetical protein
MAQIRRLLGGDGVRDIAEINLAVEALEARLADHESRLPPVITREDPNRAWSHGLSYWVKPIDPPTPNTFQTGRLGNDGPHDAGTATSRAQKVAEERARYYTPDNPEPWSVVCVGWRDHWQDVKQTGVVLIVEQLEVNGSIAHNWTWSNELPNYLKKKDEI